SFQLVVARAATEHYILSLHDALPISNDDGSHVGRFCVGGSGACSGHGAREYDAPPETNGAMAAVLDPSLQISEEMARELAELKGDRKSTRLNSSHVKISYAVFCLKKK